MKQTTSMTETLDLSSNWEFVNPHLVRHNDRKDGLEHASTLGYP